MGCASCGTSVDGKPRGCKSNGGCSSGGCNKLNTFDWLAKMDVSDYEEFDIVEVSFKNGSRKQFFQNPPHVRAIIGDNVVVESASGYDVGRISLTGELVRLQMKKKRVSSDSIFPKIIRLANERDFEKLEEARSMERHAMIRARAIARSLGLEMKLGDVEFQGDRRKATFYYTADGRVDFRELIRHYAKEFRVKIEMRQIGARQESSRIGGLGSCGRELCCSTWLTNFKSVTTGAARYQNLAINQSKLSGQCGRLKCCLNYELDTYLDALQDFPKHPERLETEAGVAILMKTDIFKRLMVYTYSTPGKRGNFYTLSVDRVKAILQMNAEGEKPMELIDSTLGLGEEEEVIIDFEDVTGAVELPPERRNKRRSRGGYKRGDRNREERGGRPGRGERKGDKREGRPERGGKKEDKKRGRFERNGNKEDKRDSRRPERGSSREDKRKSRFERNGNKEDKRGGRPERGSHKDGKREGRSERDMKKEDKRGSRTERGSNKDNKRGSRFERNGNKEDRRGSRRPERGANKEEARGSKDRREGNGKDAGGDKSRNSRFGKGRGNRYRDNRKAQEGDRAKKFDRDSSKDSNSDK